MSRQLLLTFASDEAAARFRRNNAATHDFTIADHPGDDVPPVPPYSPELFASIAANVQSILKLEYGGSADWPIVPHMDWNDQDRHELYQRAATRWALLPNGQFEKHLFIDDFESRALNHLGTRP